MKFLTVLLALISFLVAPVSVFSETEFTDFESNPEFKINQIRQKYLQKDTPNLLFQDFFSQQWRFPIQAPNSFYVTQGYNGIFSHQNKQALDMSTPNGVVAAAQSGTVGIVNFGGKWDGWCNSYNDCFNKGGIWNGNHIVINHPNGTSSYYIHMKPNSLMPGIFEGKQVTIGTPLGIVGGTGFTCNIGCSAPFEHLHFQVNSGVNTISTPFEDCQNVANNCVNNIPQEGNDYLSINYPPANQLNTGPIYLYGQRKNIDQNLRISNNKTNWFFSPTGELQINNLCLTDNGSLAITTCSNTNSQKWTPDEDNSIKNIQTGRCLARANDNINTIVTAENCSGSLTQEFRHVSQPVIINTF